MSTALRDGAGRADGTPLRRWTAESAVTVGAFLERYFAGAGRNHLKKKLEAGEVRLETEPDRRLRWKDEIPAGASLLLGPRPRVDVPLARELTLLYEDDDVIAVAKKPGLLTIASDKEKRRTAYALLNEWTAQRRQRALIVHRIDREASGAVVFAKRPGVQEELQNRWDEAVKTYLVAVEEAGRKLPDAGVWKHRLLPVSVDKMAVAREDETGPEVKEALSEFRVADRRDGKALLFVRLVTGRKHQIRVQARASGTPVAGDEKYGDKDAAPRLMLHAWTLRLPRLRPGAPWAFTAPVPVEFHRMFPGLKKILARERPDA